MNQDLKARVSTWLQQHRGDIVRDIFTLSRIPSVKGAPAPGAPFGKACRDALDEAVAMLLSDRQQAGSGRPVSGDISKSCREAKGS